eukprot:2058219-Rhodomonas_salina.1
MQQPVRCLYQHYVVPLGGCGTNLRAVCTSMRIRIVPPLGRNEQARTLSTRQPSQTPWSPSNPRP